MLVKPFCGIRQATLNGEANSNISFNTEQNNILLPSSFLENHIKNGIQKKELVRELEPYFYLCRYTCENHTCQGLIAQIDSDYLNKKIFKHEECDKEKISEFYKEYTDFNIQLSPTLLFHKENLDLETNINRLISSIRPNLTFYSYKCTYEIWTLPDTEILKKLYNSIDKFFIADGHHRISSLCYLQKNFLAYIVPLNHLRSYPILRKYNYYNDIHAQNLIKKIKTQFSLKNLNVNHLNLMQQNNFILSYKNQKFYIPHSNTKYFFQEVLNIFSSINFTPEGKLSFNNSKINSDNAILEQQIIKQKSDHVNSGLYLYIPAITSATLFDSFKKILPIHSTWFEPKIPSGIIGMEVYEPIEDNTKKYYNFTSA